MTPETARREQDWHAGYRSGNRASDLLDDALATIAGLSWEYGVMMEDGEFLNLNDPSLTADELSWTPHKDVAEDNARDHGGTLVRRPVGPVEEVEG
ncbi:hypothetical protein [Corynebacterium kalidii]